MCPRVFTGPPAVTQNATNQPKSTAELGCMFPRGLTCPPAVISKRYESTEVDHRTWLHVPSCIHWSTSSDLKTLRINRSRPQNLAVCALGDSLVHQQWSQNATNQPKSTIELGYMCLRVFTGPPAVMTPEQDKSISGFETKVETRCQEDVCSFCLPDYTIIILTINNNKQYKMKRTCNITVSKAVNRQQISFI